MGNSSITTFRNCTNQFFSWLGSVHFWHYRLNALWKISIQAFLIELLAWFDKKNEERVVFEYKSILGVGQSFQSKKKNKSDYLLALGFNFIQFLRRSLLSEGHVLVPHWIGHRYLHKAMLWFNSRKWGSDTSFWSAFDRWHLHVGLRHMHPSVSSLWMCINYIFLNRVHRNGIYNNCWLSHRTVVPISSAWSPFSCWCYTAPGNLGVALRLS